MKARRILTLIAATIVSISTISAQNSAPAPGTGGAFRPNGGNSAPAPGAGGAFTPNVAQGAGPSAPFGPNVPMWGTSNSMLNGGPWGPGAFSGPYNNGPGYNYGESKVIAVGYDAQGVWETIPMVVSWEWNGFYYDVTVENAWNPWTQMWEGDNLDIPAFQTTYTLRGVPYSYYANLSTGTYYFNL